MRGPPSVVSSSSVAPVLDDGRQPCSPGTSSPGLRKADLRTDLLPFPPGGAERLVVDAAIALQRRGHSVEIFTSRHDPTRCFEETQNGAAYDAPLQPAARQPSPPAMPAADPLSSCLPAPVRSTGTLKVHVLGGLLPRSLLNSLHIVFAILRQLHLTLSLLLSLSPLVPRVLKALPDLAPFDVFFVDQLSVCVPVLRWLLQTRVVFYCHFPDKLLSGGWDLTTAGSQAGPTRKDAGGPRDVLKGLYRLPVDVLEEFSTGAFGPGLPSATRPPRAQHRRG